MRYALLVAACLFATPAAADMCDSAGLQLKYSFRSGQVVDRSPPDPDVMSSGLLYAPVDDVRDVRMVRLLQSPGMPTGVVCQGTLVLADGRRARGTFTMQFSGTQWLMSWR